MFLEKNEPEQLVSDKSEGVFATVRSKALRMREIWQNIYQEFQKSDSRYTDELKAHNTHFEQALDKLLADLTTPMLTLATTGTTSSGKSTLVNLLCGADIMPRMAGEMSAGIVTIKHSSKRQRHLKIQSTENATWDCGEWQDLNDNEIREKLTSTMDSFNRAKQHVDLSSPIIELTYPIACFFPYAGLLNLSDLPENTQFQIIDLPGKRNQDDQINSSVIQHCRQALSIVTYDMAQTDEKLRQSLMEEVLDQVKLMGGSPARMLFALNRIDVFSKDYDWQRREQEAVNQTIEEIKQIIHERLPEHRQSLERLSYGKLSSLPALLAWQIKTTENNNKTSAAEQINDHFAFMIPEKIKEDLPRSVKKWNDVEYGNISNAIWNSSYANDFYALLGQHIHDNFSKLVITPTLIAFEDRTMVILNDIINSCNAKIDIMTNGYEIVEQNLRTDHEAILAILESSYTELMQPIENLPSVGENEMKELRNIINSTKNHQGFYQTLPEGTLSPLYTASEEINRWLSGALEGAMQSLKQGKINFSGTQADYLSSKHQDRLSVICKNLMGKGYTTEIANRGTIITSIENKTEEMDRLKKGLSDFSGKLSSLLHDIYIEKSKRENHRIRESLESTIFNFFEYLNKKIKEGSIGLAIKIPSLILQDIAFNNALHINLTNDLTKDKPSSRRNPWRLWTMTQSVIYTDIPSTAKLHEEYIKNLNAIEKNSVKSCVEITKKYLEEIEVKMTRYIDATMDDLGEKYETAFDEIQKDYSTNIDYWEKLKIKPNELMNILQNIKAA
ncbi:dynamin family protein [Thiothrix unzii]|jgi:GTPase Era involved in 16S rRNA processing|uniref:Dynamin family protein n=1 Tax=Thiothrix unzii TaxID=111769 RepID=A0A975FA12_9GAMM|nr:dynamin family protein [Thiothrix unzii]QTR53669.1 dynamin family protein [Thiothrix unzii]